MRNLLAIMFWILAVGAYAAVGDMFSGAGSRQPIEIEAQALEVLQQEKKAIFSGQVRAKQGNVNLKADKMTVFYSDKTEKSAGANNAITKIEVAGNVLLSTPQESASGSYGVYDTVRNLIVLEGNVVLTKDRNILKGNRLDFDIDKGHSKLDGGVSATGQSGGRVRGLFVPEGADGN